jgi:hypothetical protein
MMNFKEANFKLTVEGNIVLTVGFYRGNAHYEITPKQKERTRFITF